MTQFSDPLAPEGLPGPVRSERSPPRGSVAELIAEAAAPLRVVHDPTYTSLFDRFGSARVVLLGAATHGTSELYEARAAITRRLVEQYGFNIVALEAGWPDARAVDRYVRYRANSLKAQPAFQQFPTWMWRNAEFDGFMQWLRDHNRFRTMDDRVSVHGLDIYNPAAALRAVIEYLDQVDPEAAATARARYGRLASGVENPQADDRQALAGGHPGREPELNALLQDLLRERLQYEPADGEAILDAGANAKVLAEAEAYFCAAVFDRTEAWNLRAQHMMDTLAAILEARGADSKAVVWAHNAHVGDARAAAMGRDQGQMSLGQLARESFGDASALVGLDVGLGAVACASDWGRPMEVKPLGVPPPESYERLAWESGVSAFMLDLRRGCVDENLRRRLSEPRPERFVGAIYRPETEPLGQFATCVLPERYDAYVWFERSHPVHPLTTEPGEGAAETYLSGL